ncbi:hypothetical protein CVT24_006252 [Panaeolus cyanescens]|uniref:Uncharacterized protein n=1 Tax=Panaeolus cyanescens TaxID=181874 RepID=A0A409YEK5_9AGAR|nr:hypothetical protein CVT24_006252 [Panaeolus cyanescens]
MDNTGEFERPRKLRKQSKSGSLSSVSRLRILGVGKRSNDDEPNAIKPPSTAVSDLNSTAQAKRSAEMFEFGIAEALLDPNYYTTLLLQASDARFTSQSNPSTPPPSPSRSTRARANHANDASPRTPPSTPLSQGSLRVRGTQTFGIGGEDSNEKNLSVNRRPSRMLDPILEGVTYDAILTSTLNKSLGNEDDDYLVPQTQVPPNTPAPVIQEGGFASLMCVSLAIMEGKVQTLSDAMAY